MFATGAAHFSLDFTATTARRHDFPLSGEFIALLAHDGSEAVGFIALTETRSLCAGGMFGIIPDFYVTPEFERTLHFYQTNGFSIAGGRRLKMAPVP